MGGTIWCYTIDPSVEKEECYPHFYCKNTITSNAVVSKDVKYQDPLNVFSA